MAITDIITSDLPDNTTFEISPADLRTVLNAMVADYEAKIAELSASGQVQSQKFVRSFPGVSIDWEESFEHDLNSAFVAVFIYVDGQIIPSS